MTDVSPALQTAIRAALSMNEVGGNKDVAYRLSFAGQAASGASFGEFQADCSANPNALLTLRQILINASVPVSNIGRILGLLRSPCRTNPLSPSDTAMVNAALSAPPGRALVDQMDEETVQTVFGYVDLANDAARDGLVSIGPAAQIAIALWCNMSGKPTLLLAWLENGPVVEDGVTVAEPGNPVSMDDIGRYLNSTGFFRAHPQDWPHFSSSVNAGLATLPAAA
jgi:hypothetical protein